MGSALRRLNAKAKDQRELRFPDHLVEFLSEVARGVDAGTEDTLIASDDLLQAGEFVYGGLDEEGGDVFSFTFFPHEGTVRHKWLFSLTKQELGAVAGGRLNSLTMWCCRTPDCHSAFRDPDDTCFYCDWEPPGERE